MNGDGFAYTTGTLTGNEGALSFDFTGNVFRLIPHGSTEPLGTSFSLQGGRWNPPNAFPVMYVFTDTGTARDYMRAQETFGAFSWADVQPERQRDLLVLSWSVSGLIDLATEDGLAVYNLPATYPTGFETQATWSVTQPIGLSIYESGSSGLVTRSASTTDFSRPAIQWSELAVFAERVGEPVLVERVSFGDWYGT